MPIVCDCTKEKHTHERKERKETKNEQSAKANRDADKKRVESEWKRNFSTIFALLHGDICSIYMYELVYKCLLFFSKM